MRRMTIQNVKQLVEKTNTFTEMAVKAYNNKYIDPEKILVKNGTRRPRIKEEQEALDRFKLK